MKVLGLTAPISENTAACIVVDGQLVAMVEEERFTGIKHAPRAVPKQSIVYCLKEAGCTLDEIDAIAIGFDTVWWGWLKNIVANVREGNFSRAVREAGAYTEYFVNVQRLYDFLASLSLQPRTTILKKVQYVSHHVAHAASAARCSGFTECNILSLDGVGENEAGFLGYFKNNTITKVDSIPINQSLGWLYSSVTDICGFKAHSHEGKIMALASFGTADLTTLHGIAELTDTSYVLRSGWTARLYRRFGPRRKKDEPLTQVHKDLAASVQLFLEEAGKRLAKRLYRQTGFTDLALAGGVALNCDMNAKLLALDEIKNIFVQPAANDAGTALGAAYEYYATRTNETCMPLTHTYYGPQYNDSEIEALLKESRIVHRRLASIAEVAQKLKDGKIIGWFQGRIEFGPRALGNRSLVAHPGLSGMKDKINKQVKHREDWRPFAPSIMIERAPDYFENYFTSPFMLLTFKVPKKRLAQIQAAAHVDATARVQEVSRDHNPRYWELINEFEKLTGIPVVLNTSFNDKEKPICLTPRDAVQTFFTTGMDVLVLGNFIIEK